MYNSLYKVNFCHLKVFTQFNLRQVKGNVAGNLNSVALNRGYLDLRLTIQSQS